MDWINTYLLTHEDGREDGKEGGKQRGKKKKAGRKDSESIVVVGGDADLVLQVTLPPSLPPSLPLSLPLSLPPIRSLRLPQPF